MTSAAELVARLSSTLEGTLERVLPRQCDCALVDFPDYRNVGDHAIWLGQMALLQRTGRSVVYACTPDSYEPDVMARRVGSSPILLSGGGNLGDLYSRNQELRERIVRDFPGNKIVQMPQSIHFVTTESLAKARKSFEVHPDFTVLVREERSLGLARRHFPDCNTMLCPDMAFALGPLPRLGMPRYGIVAQHRDDMERLSDDRDLDVRGAALFDWQAPAGRRRRGRIRRVADAIGSEPLLRQLGRDDIVAWGCGRIGNVAVATAQAGYRTAAPARLVNSVVNRASHSHLRRGRRMLSRGRVVVTNRLHGHVLCVMMGIPHIVCDNSYGKIKSFFDTWISTCELAQWSNSFPEGLDLAREMAW